MSAKWRVYSIVAFVLLVPLLALPRVNETCDQWLFGDNQEALAFIDFDALPPRVEPTDSGPESIAIDEPNLPARLKRLPPTNVGLSQSRYLEVQERLQALGVDYLVLERAPGVEPMYRFHCQVAIPGSRVYVRPFEAVDADPQHAMERVLREVEAWTATRNTPGKLLR